MIHSGKRIRNGPVAASIDWFVRKPIGLGTCQSVGSVPGPISLAMVPIKIKNTIIPKAYTLPRKWTSIIQGKSKAGVSRILETVNDCRKFCPKFRVKLQFKLLKVSPGLTQNLPIRQEYDVSLWITERYSPLLNRHDWFNIGC